MCKKHKTCAAGEWTKAEGTAKVDTQCKTCSSGRFRGSAPQGKAKEIENTVCQLHKTCAAGEWTEAAGTINVDTKCKTCSSGHFRDNAPQGKAKEIENTVCRLHKTCTVGEWTAATGTIKVDTQCKPCSAGRFRDSVPANSNTRGFAKACVKSTGKCFYNIMYNWPEDSSKTAQNLLKRCQDLGLDRPLPINDDENVAMQKLCPASLIGIVSCHGSGTSDWCDVKAHNGVRLKYLKWHGSEGSSPKQVASGLRSASPSWFDASREDGNAGQTTCCEYIPNEGE